MLPAGAKNVLRLQEHGNLYLGAQAGGCFLTKLKDGPLNHKEVLLNGEHAKEED